MKFLKRIFSPTCLTISLSLLIYTFYKSEIYWNGQKNDYYFTYYIISLILIFFSIITFFLSQKIKEYLIILGASLILGIYLFEGFLTFKQSQISKHKLIKDTGFPLLSTTNLAIYEICKKAKEQGYKVIIVEMVQMKFLAVIMLII